MDILNLNEELTIFEVRGTDAQNYLQGQLTNDIRELDHKPFQYSAHLNNKGRVLATFIITKPAVNTYYLITTKNISDKIVPRLKMFILRSKVTLAPSSKSISLSNIAQNNSHCIELLPKTYINISEDVIAGHKTNNNQWHQFLVENSIPIIYAESMEKIIPQQINYDLTGGINFKKGCYTGQEIVARTHYLGKVKRRMAKFTCDYKPTIGQTVVSPALDNQEVGFIIDYYQINSQYQGLVSLQNDCLNSTYLDIENKQPLNCQPLINE